MTSRVITKLTMLQLPPGASFVGVSAVCRLSSPPFVALIAMAILLCTSSDPVRAVQRHRLTNPCQNGFLARPNAPTLTYRRLLRGLMTADGWSTPLPVASLFLGPYRPSRQPPWPPPPPWHPPLPILLFFSGGYGASRFNGCSIGFEGTSDSTPTFTYRLYCLQEVVLLSSSTGSGSSHDFINFAPRITLQSQIHGAFGAYSCTARQPGTGTTHRLSDLVYQVPGPLQVRSPFMLRGRVALWECSTTARPSGTDTMYCLYVLQYRFPFPLQVHSRRFTFMH